MESLIDGQFQETFNKPDALSWWACSCFWEVGKC